jgi:hypothetical protein
VSAERTSYDPNAPARHDTFDAAGYAVPEQHVARRLTRPPVAGIHWQVAPG